MKPEGFPFSFLKFLISPTQLLNNVNQYYVRGMGFESGCPCLIPDLNENKSNFVLYTRFSSRIMLEYIVFINSRKNLSIVRFFF